MTALRLEFGLSSVFSSVAPNHRSYRPPSWPPPLDWVISEDESGGVVSRWGDAIWDFSYWARRRARFHFESTHSGTGKSPLDRSNADLLRMIITWRIWGPRPLNSINSIRSLFRRMRTILEICSLNGIDGRRLSHYPKLLEEVSKRIEKSAYSSTLAELHRLLDARENLGFVLVDAAGIARLASAQPAHVTQQVVYIPPRIWAYQVQRLRLCLEDYLAHADKFRACYNFCLDAYAHNFGSLENALKFTSNKFNNRQPFQKPRSARHGHVNGCQFFGEFEAIAERFEIGELLRRWVRQREDGLDVRQLSGYLSLVQYAGLSYIANFTLQRISEVSLLRADCLTWEDDPSYGKIALVRSETSKTVVDSDARWLASPSIKVAVDAMTSVTFLRMRCIAANPLVAPSLADQSNPFLFDRVAEPWTSGLRLPYSIRRNPRSYALVYSDFPKLFDLSQVAIQEEDLDIATRVTPNLQARRGFSVGKPWPWSWHQLRRTGAVNMFASGLVSDSTVQFQLKHSSLLMSLYYGQGHGNLRLNKEVESLVIHSMYESMARAIQKVGGDNFISPHGQERKDDIVRNLLSERNVNALASAAKKGEVFFREIRLGACTKRGVCDYGGVESVARCAGGDGRAPCADVLYDRNRKPSVERDLSKVERALEECRDEAPRRNALEAERNGLENYLDAIKPE